jgi:hypothetical protein
MATSGVLASATAVTATGALKLVGLVEGEPAARYTVPVGAVSGHASAMWALLRVVVPAASVYVPREREPEVNAVELLTKIPMVAPEANVPPLKTSVTVTVLVVPTTNVLRYDVIDPDA